MKQPKNAALLILTEKLENLAYAIWSALFFFVKTTYVLTLQDAGKKEILAEATEAAVVPVLSAKMINVSKNLSNAKKMENLAEEAMNAARDLNAKADNAKNLRLIANGKKRIAAEEAAIRKKENIFAALKGVKRGNVQTGKRNA